MKRTLLVLLFSALFFSCNEKKTEKEELPIEASVTETSSLQTYQGEFIYTSEASVFKGSSFVYGVEMNSVAKELGKKVQAIKKSDYDMVPVIVKGKVTHKPEGTEGWDEIITITEIINVSDTPTKADVELKETKS